MYTYIYMYAYIWCICVYAYAYKYVCICVCMFWRKGFCASPVLSCVPTPASRVETVSGWQRSIEMMSVRLKERSVLHTKPAEWVDEQRWDPRGLKTRPNYSLAVVNVNGCSRGFRSLYDTRELLSLDTLESGPRSHFPCTVCLYSLLIMFTSFYLDLKSFLIDS